MEELLALGCFFYEMYLERPQRAIRDVTGVRCTRPVFTVMATSKAMQLKACIHLLENQGCLDNLLQFCMP